MEGEPLSAAEPKKHMEQKDLLEALYALSDTEKQRLRLIARNYASVADGMDADDLLQEALMKVHEDKRHCPVDVDPCVFIKGVMRSLASNSKEMARRSKEYHDAEAALATADLFAARPVSAAGRSAEEMLIGKQRDEAFHAFLSEACNGCETTELVLMGLLDGLRGKALCDAAGVTKQELATIRKRITRMMDRFDKERRDT